MTTIVALLVVGAFLLFLETMLPGLIAGIIGLGCIGAAVGMAYIRFGVSTGNSILAVAAAGLIVGTIFYVIYFPKSKVAQMFVLKTVIGGIGNEDPGLLHQKGKALTTLRPSGTAMINGHRVDVVSEGAFIEAGAPIKVIALEGLRVVVRADA